MTGLLLRPMAKFSHNAPASKTPYAWHVITYVVQDKADKDVQRDAEEVDDGGSDLLGHMLAPHLHHAWPEDAHHELKGTESYQLNLARSGDPCTKSMPSMTVRSALHWHLLEDQRTSIT